MKQKPASKRGNAENAQQRQANDLLHPVCFCGLFVPAKVVRNDR